MISTDNEMTKLILLILIVAVIFAIFYIVTLFVTKKDEEIDKTADNSVSETVIDYSKILAGNILSQKDKEYYINLIWKICINQKKVLYLFIMLMLTIL